jgi:chemotaxis protein CheC
LGSIGAGHATTALSQVLQEPVSIEVPKIHSIPAHQVPRLFQKHEHPTTAIYMQLSGQECDILLLFDIQEARKIAAMMTMAPSVDEMDPALGASAIEELANILIGAFLSALSDFTGVNLVPTPPERVEDSFDAIIDNFLVKQSMVSNEAIVFDTRFKRTSSDASCILMMFPSKELQALLTEKSVQWIDKPANTDESQVICSPESAVNISSRSDAENAEK